MKKNADTMTYGIIGLGRFGTALAIELAQQGCDLLVLDRNEEKIRQIRAYTDHAFVATSLSKEVLEEAGVQNCDVVVVAIGSQIDVSILTTLTLVDLGIKKVIAKATSDEQGSVLKKLGAEIIYPERDMALRLAKKLTSNSLIEYISLSNQIEISEMKVSGPLIGKNLIEADLRGKFGINVIALEHEHTTETSISPNYQFKEEDMIVVIGKGDDIQKFQDYLLG